MYKQSKKVQPQPRRKDTGASQSRVSSSAKMSSYFSHHRSIAGDSFVRILKTPLPSIMTWLVIGIALALPGALFIALSNVEAVSKGWDGNAQISLYVHKAVTEQQSREVADNIRLRDDVAAVEYISSVQALEEFKSLSGYGEVLAQLNNNPLPAVIVVRPIEENAQTTIIAQRLFQDLQAIPQVEQAVIDLEWLQRLYTMMALGKRISLALALVLSLGVLLVIGNTIRLAIESRRDEIIIVKLVGATNAFVRRPFLYTGMWYGLGGGIMAWLIMSISVGWLAKPVARLAGLYQSEFTLQGLGGGQAMLLCLAAASLGLLGAWLAVGRHLGEIEPR